MAQFTETQLRAAACMQAQDRANRAQVTVYVYRGERDGEPCYYVRTGREGAPDGATIYGELVPES